MYNLCMIQTHVNTLAGEGVCVHKLGSISIVWMKIMYKYGMDVTHDKAPK